MTELRNKRLWAIACHEAGHAVIGRILGLSCGSVTIIGESDQENVGHAIVDDPIRSWRHGDGPRRQLVEKSVICLYAGGEAEHVILGTRGEIVGDGPDRRKASSLIELVGVRGATFVGDDIWERYEDQLRKKSNDLVHQHRDKIERVARALLKSKTLEGEEIDRLVRSH